MGAKTIEVRFFFYLDRRLTSTLKIQGHFFGTPIERLAKMNKPAIDLYKSHGIDLEKEYLEIAVCAQHNNGGLVGNIGGKAI